MEAEVMKALLEAFEQSDWQEMAVTIGGDRLHVSRRADGSGPALGSAPDGAVPAAPPAPAPSPQGAAAGGSNGAAPAAPDTAAAAPAGPAAAAVPTTSAGSDAGAAPAGAPETVTAVAGGVEVTAPSVGLFWRAPAPGAPPFVEVGGSVQAGDTVAIVEVMKLMNHVTAPTSGTVSAVLVENGAAVEFGQPLVVIEPEG